MTIKTERGLFPNLYLIEEVKKNWGWFLFLGILLVLLGSVMVGSSYYATVFSIMLFGALLISGGVVQFIQAFMARRWSGFFLSLILAILYIVTGVLCITNPAAAAVSLTLLIAGFCLVAGLFRMLSALFIRFDQWGWVFFNGLVTFILGILIYSNWPISGLWVIGLFIGIDLILTGWTWIMLSLYARSQLKLSK